MVAQAPPLDDLRVHRLRGLPLLRDRHHHPAVLDRQPMGHPLGPLLYPADWVGEGVLCLHPSWGHVHGLHVSLLCPVHDQPAARQVLCHSDHEQKQLGNVRPAQDGGKLHPPPAVVGVGGHLVRWAVLHHLQGEPAELADPR